MRSFVVKSIICICILVCALPTYASIVINEVAWMGTTNSANDEWIELYNTSDSSVDLSGWRLHTKDGSPDVTLEGSIGAHEYFLLERTDDETVGSVMADQIYIGALGNDGEILQLHSGEGTLIDEVRHADEWLAGDNTTKETMQKNGNTWVTATGTPKAENTSNSSESSNTTSPNNSSENTTNNVTEEKDTKETKNDVYDKEKKHTFTYALETRVDPVIVAGLPARFDIIVKRDGERRLKGLHVWSFGDGTVYKTNKYPSRSEFRHEHTYHQPGDYILLFEYYSSMLQADPDIVHRIRVHVVEPQIQIAGVVPGEYIELRNDSEEEIDISGWSLVSGGEMFTFPENTIMDYGTSLRIDYKVTELPASQAVVLRYPNKDIAASYQVRNQHTTDRMQTIPSQNNVARKQVIQKAPVQTPKQPIQELESEYVRQQEVSSVVFDGTERTQDNPVHKGHTIPSTFWYVLILGVFVLCSGMLVAYLWTKQNGALSQGDTQEDVVDDSIEEIQIIED